MGRGCPQKDRVEWSVLGRRNRSWELQGVLELVMVIGVGVIAGVGTDKPNGKTGHRTIVNSKL